MSNNRPNVLLEFREDNKQLFITNMKNMESKYSQSRKFNYNTVDIFKCGIGCVRSNILSIKDRQGNKFIVKLLTLHEYEITEYIFDNLKGLCKSYVVSSSVMYVPPPVADKYTGSEFYMYLLIMPFYENTPGVKDARKRWSLPSRRSAASELLNFKKKLLFRMAVGIECLHAAGVSHSDIKDENFFGDDVLIDTMILDGVRAWTGAFNADYFEIGRLILENVRIGDDGDINSADFIINSSVSINTVNDGVLEEPVFIR